MPFRPASLVPNCKEHCHVTGQRLTGDRISNIRDKRTPSGIYLENCNSVKCAADYMETTGTNNDVSPSETSQSFTSAAQHQQQDGRPDIIRATIIPTA